MAENINSRNVSVIKDADGKNIVMINMAEMQKMDGIDMILVLQCLFIVMMANLKDTMFSMHAFLSDMRPVERNICMMFWK